MKIQSIKASNAIIKNTLKFNTNPVKFLGNDKNEKDSFSKNSKTAEEIARVEGIINYLYNWVDTLKTDTNSNKTQRDKKKILSDIAHFIKRIKIYESYSYVLQGNEKYAFYFNPELDDEQKEAQMLKSGILSKKQLAEKLGLQDTITLANWYNDKLIPDSYKLNDSNDFLVDINSDENKEFVGEILKRREDFVFLSELCEKLDIPDDERVALVRDAKIVPFGYDDDYFKYNRIPSTHPIFLDTKNKKNAKTIEEIKRMHPVESKYVNAEYIPASYIVKLGFCDGKTIVDALRKGTIRGKVIKPKDGTKQRIEVKNDIQLERVLKGLRDINQDTYEPAKLARELGVKRFDILDAVKSGELETIPEYLFKTDRKKIFISKLVPKNEEHILKILFEKELEERMIPEYQEEQKQKKIKKLAPWAKTQALKAALICEYCVETRKIASELLQKDKTLYNLIKRENKGEVLFDNDKEKANSYKKEMWEKAGTEEFKEGYNFASTAIEEFNSKGINNVKNDRAKEIIKMYFNIK